MSSLFNIPVSAIKVRIPPKRAEIITRPRLIELLYDQVDRPLLFVVAPAGYGKTSLLIDLAGQVELPVCWLSLDTLDQDPQRFLRYVIAAIAERFPHFGRDSLSVLENITSLTTDQEQILVTITNEIHACIREHFMLVLDDFHFVEGSELVIQLLNRFLQLMGENVQIIIASRNTPDLPIALLMIARNQVGGVSFRDLSFRTEEIQILFQQNKKIELSQDDAETLLRETEGWIAAIHLSNGLPDSLPHIHPLESTTVLFDFFAREVMEKQSEPYRKFLLWTSMFDVFDASLCERVLNPLVGGESLDWKLMFDKVRATNLFTVPLDQAGYWMRYHHLFQHFLRAQLQYEEPALAWNIQQNLAYDYEQQQNWEEALQVYDRLNDYPNQVRLLSEIGTNFVMAGRILTMHNWLLKIPVELLYSQPMLISHLAVVHFTQGDQHRALALLNQAEEGLRGVDEDKSYWLITLCRRAEAQRQIGNLAAALQDVQEILEVVENDSAYMDHSLFADALRTRGVVNFGMGNMREALSFLEKALQRYQLLGLQNMIPVVETELGVVHRRLGEPQVSELYYASALKNLEKGGDSGWKARLLNNMGVMKYMSGQMEEAYHLFNESLQIAELCGYLRLKTNAWHSLGDLFVALDDLDSAFTFYDQALTLASNLGHSMNIFFASLGEARIKRLRGNAESALLDLHQMELSQISLGSYERAFLDLERGLCFLDLNRVEDALPVFRNAQALFSEGGNQAEQLVPHLWSEVTQAVLNGRESLVELIPPQREWRIPSFLMLHAGRAARWLRLKKQTRLLKKSSLRLFFEQAERLLDSLPSLADRIQKPAAKTGTDTPRLEIISFGTVQVRHDGRLLEISDWQTREARDLFLFLLQSPPRTKEQIAADFWPDLPPSKLKMRFKINMYRIRQALGQDAVIFQDEYYSFNRGISYNWDRERFDELFNEAQVKTVIPERIKTLEEALKIAHTRYLADLDAFWVEADRLGYEERRKAVMLGLAELYLQVEREQDGLNLTRQILRSDPLLEAAHRLSLKVYAAQHDPAGLALHYNQYQKLLEDELGMLPSLEMRTLYETLLSEV